MPKHIPVLLDPILKLLGDINGKIIIDATFGNGGYTTAFLKSGATVIAFDRDENVIPTTEKIKSKYGDKFYFIAKPFSELETISDETPFKSVDAIVFDFGMSSMQIDNAERGFSYQSDGPLDMRMGHNEMSASEYLNSADANAIAKIIKLYGDDNRARFIAKKIVESRPLKTTFDLKNAIASASYDPKSIARVFQAIRIHINNELGEIETALNSATKIINENGIIAAVSFHSLEDRLTKQFMRDMTTAPGDPRLPSIGNAPFKLLIKSGIEPDENELKNNPRSRSARLRAIQKMTTNS